MTGMLCDNACGWTRHDESSHSLLLGGWSWVSGGKYFFECSCVCTLERCAIMMCCGVRLVDCDVGCVHGENECVCGCACGCLTMYGAKRA